jgi:Flp pilus assembly pilin Flp
MIGRIKESTTYVIEGPSAPPSPTIIIKNGPVARFLKDDRGEHAIEILMILTFGVLPLIFAVYLLEDVLQEYVAFGQIFISSPFF